MGRGGAKHSKNRCSGQGGSGFTADEKAKANSAQTYGTVVQRLSGDSIKDWDCCSLSLQPCVEPVVTPQGVIYDKEAIYSYILKEKQRIAADVTAWKAQQASKPVEERAKRQAEVDEATRQFEEAECGILPMSKRAKTSDDPKDKFDTLAAGQKEVRGGAQKAHASALGHKSLLEGELMSKSKSLIPADNAPQACDTSNSFHVLERKTNIWDPNLRPPPRAAINLLLFEPVASNTRSNCSTFCKSLLPKLRQDQVHNQNQNQNAHTKPGKQAKDSCFWIPDLTPEFKAKELGQPDEKVYCPISKQPLRLKDLVPIKFTPLDKKKDMTVNNTNANERFMCPVSFKTLSNATPAAVLRKSGKCIAMDVVTNVIKKDMLDPFGGGTLKEKDIIPLMRGGTGFAGSGLKMTAEKYNPVMRSY